MSKRHLDILPTASSPRPRGEARAPASAEKLDSPLPLTADTVPTRNSRPSPNGSVRAIEQRSRPRPERLDLTRRAPQVIRRHLARSFVRVMVLLSGDVLALLGLRGLLDGASDHRWFGETVASVIRSVVPGGALPLEQLLPAVLLGLVVLDTYGANDRRRDSARLVAGATFGLGLPFWGYLWAHPSLLAIPSFVLLAGIISMVLIIERHLIDQTVRRLRPEGSGAAHALLIARGGEAAHALGHPALADRREFSIRGIVDPRELRNGNGQSVVSRLCGTIKQYRADTLVLAGTLDDHTFAAILDAAGAAGCQVYALTRSFTLGGLEPTVIFRRGAPLVALTRPGLQGRQLVLKRTVDIVGSALGLVLLSPLFAGLAVAVKLTSPGPVFFRQRRVGRGGTPFVITKFRSMVQDAETLREELSERSIYADPRLFKLKLDPRVTRVGDFLRRTSLDELPQLVNVLRGEMSLVGPRPPLPSEVDLYEEHHYTRFDMKPGMTGPWQVNGRNAITDFEEVIRLENDYIREWTVWKDLGILLRTIPAVFTMRGAH
jgi:exopolysaccharide biosynthesis polyprenyl glycosylphosphotransferase